MTPRRTQKSRGVVRDAEIDSEIDAEIRPLVRAFNECGLETHGSCCGHRNAKRKRRGQAEDAAYLMFSVRGVEELHQFVAALNDVSRNARDVLFKLTLNWDEEVCASLDPDDPRRLPFDLILRDISSRSDRAPTAEQFARITALFAKCLPKHGVGR